MLDIITYACTFIVGLGGAGAIIISIIKWLQKPDSTRDEKLNKHQELLESDNKRLKELEEWKKENDEAQRFIMRSLLAIMSHELDGNHTAGLSKARDDLQEYLIRR